jgi:hypothetical protein
MFSLQSDFIRHSLTKLLGAVELRTLISSHTFVILCHPQATPLNHTVLKQSSRPTSSDSLQVWLGKAKSSDVALSIPQCSLLFGLMLLYYQCSGNAYSYFIIFVLRILISILIYS